MRTKDRPGVVEHIFDHSRLIVWSSLTDTKELVQWSFDNIPELKPELGIKTKFNVKASSRDFLHFWEVIEVVPNRKIVTNLLYKGFSGESLATIGLFEQDQNTKLVVSTKV